jgi:2-iminobutanoate/2-iminopropanoate deaminase
MRQIVHTDAAPAAVGPYSQAVQANGFVFCSGQIALDPITGQLTAESIEGQTHQIFANIKAVLAEAGSGLEHVVKTTVFLVDMGEFQAMNAVYTEYFTEAPPARSTVAVKALPLGARVEIEVTALMP